MSKTNPLPLPAYGVQSSAPARVQNNPVNFVLPNDQVEIVAATPPDPTYILRINAGAREYPGLKWDVAGNFWYGTISFVNLSWYLEIKLVDKDKLEDLFMYAILIPIPNPTLKVGDDPDSTGGYVARAQGG